MSLRWRLTAVIGGVVAVMVAGASLLAYISADRELNRQVDEFLVSRSREAEAGLQETNLSRLNVQQAFQLGALTRPDAGVMVLFPQGQSLVISTPGMPPTEQDIDIAQREGKGAKVYALQDRIVDGEQYRVLTTSIDEGALIIGRSVGDVDKTLDGLRGWLIVISLMGSLAAGIIGWLVADRVLRPVARLAAATQQVAETRRFDADLRVEGSDELGALATSFNSMLSALRASKEQQQRLVRDANHELRTPLTSLRTNVDVLRRRGEMLDPEERGAVMAEMDAEVRELTGLVSELVDFATDASSLDPADFVEVDLVEAAQKVADRTAKRTGRSVEVRGEPRALVMADPTGLERALGNLLGNAVKFSPASTAIDVMVDHDRVAVCDRGPGIPPGDHERIFDRFYRSDQTRTLPGSGLGLGIVADVATAHGGTTFAQDRPGGGAVVGFTVAVDPA
jgi:two-component system sensor histidine kinase MprB